MFGLENQKKKKETPDFVFDLENDFKDPKKRKLLKDKVEEKLLRIKDKEEYDKFGVMLHGYTSLVKVMSRFK
jgi:hypothetical protein